VMLTVLNSHDSDLNTTGWKFPIKDGQHVLTRDTELRLAIRESSIRPREDIVPDSEATTNWPGAS
jgi:hypothetical protein